MVGLHLEGCKNSRHNESPKVFASVGQHNAPYHWRKVGQSHHFPEVTSRYNYQEIGRESPNDTSQCRQRLPEIEGPQQDIESKKIGKQIPDVIG